MVQFRNFQVYLRGLMMCSRPNRLEKNRNQRPKQFLRLGGYMIITDTAETEVNYFKGFRSTLPNHLEKDIQFKIFSGKDLKTIIDFASSERNKDARFRNVWIIFDRDEVLNFDNLIDEINQADMNVGWSNPCFEIWMSAYFGKMKNDISSVKCCSEFERLYIKHSNKKDYVKSDRDIYKVLYQCGDEKKAIEIAKEKFKTQNSVCGEFSKPSEMIGCSTVYQLIEEIKQKIQNSDS